jgi:hypothetical protein
MSMGENTLHYKVHGEMTRMIRQAVWRFVGIPYLMVAVGLLILSGWNVAWIPDSSYYQPPNSCVSLECRHPLARDREGNLYCSVYPPREIKLASVSEKSVFYRRLGGMGASLLGLAGAFWMVLVAGAWIAGRATPDRSKGWFNFVSVLAPAATVVLGVASVWLKAVYGFVPK